MTTTSPEHFPHLFTPGRIGSMELRNRIVMCPMGVCISNEDGSVSDNEAAFYEARARGGAALLLIGTAQIAYPEGTNHPRMPAVSDDRYLPGMQGLAARVHQHGAKIAAQLNYMGKYADMDIEKGEPRLVPYVLPEPKPDRISMMVSASEAEAMARAFVAPTSNLEYKIADDDDIRRVIGLYASAAERCQRAGYDGVELHAGHGYLIDEFLTPRNPREDEWGGDIEGRARFLVEVIRAVREAVGPTYPVWIRINAVERHHVVGEEFEDQLRAIELAVAAGIDAVHLTSYANTDVATAATDSYAPHEVGPLGDYAARVRAQVDVPVITFGRFEPQEAEQVIADGKADFVAMGRKLLADPDLPRKLEAGRTDDVRPCIYSYRCIGNIYLREPARCVVNARMGREAEIALDPTAKSRSILVVGGGPAGMQAAQLLAERGHRVTLREASERLGGMLAIAARTDPVLDAYLGWLIRQVEQADVEILVGAPVDAASVGGDVDDIVVATGASWNRGVDLPGGAEWTRSFPELGGWLLDDDDTVGREVVILGATKAALSVADVCERRGRRVSVVSPTNLFAGELGLPGRFQLVSDLEGRGVTLITEASVTGVGQGAVTISRAGVVEELDADSVIVATPTAPNRSVFDELASRGTAVHAIGDCDAIGFLEGATNSAMNLARAIE